MKNKKMSEGFTLIELIAVLVILAIVALIVTPLVLNVVRKSQDSADKRSVDAYGKSIDLAVATYLMDKGDFPTSVDDLTIEYSGQEVVCGIKRLSTDSSVYLSECAVGGRYVKDSSTEDGYYHYGTTIYKEYKIGDVITYNGMNFYVIENSNENSDSVTMLKEEPLTVDEVNTYGVEHVNMYVTSDKSSSYYQAAYDENGYGGMSYYSSRTCGYTITGWKDHGCTTDYTQSEVRYVLDAWAKDKFQISDLKEDETGYKVRLITFEELTNNLGYSIKSGSTNYTATADVTPGWVYNSNYTYWTMSQYDDSNDQVWSVTNYAVLNNPNFSYGNGYSLVVRPVVTLKKAVI